MSRSLLVIGAGGHGRVVADTAEVSGFWSRIAFLDDRFPTLRSSGRWSVIGGLDTLPSLRDDWSECVVAIGDNAIRLERQTYLKSLGMSPATVIHPSALIARDVVLGAGTVIFANGVINTGSRLGEAVIVNTAATIDHDNCIGSGVHLSPGVHLAGDVTVGERSWIGIGAAVIQGMRIGADVIVGAGGVVARDIADGMTAVGVPAKPRDRS